MNVGNAGVVSFNNGVLLSLTNSGSVTATGTFSTPVGINHGKLTVEEFISNEGDKFTNSGSFELTGTKTPIINGQFTNDLGNFSGKWNNLSIGQLANLLTSQEQLSSQKPDSRPEAN